ncbi:hypothetical protein DLAC_09147 [Tieghemostelium lacteum]|uniref:Uncharacterized protein n=1 Tax=Tieghemostelium lacteum TaxID=361077 RepID=A0A151Z996_TIELA|nr:hypothetical protein DLAC_09147 [Tieghemostelium lacteum]|eukprot:KYQ90522.1 hypothetical protein DLAC_09147 [Tieghemostelium lacteum]
MTSSVIECLSQLLDIIHNFHKDKINLSSNLDTFLDQIKNTKDNIEQKQETILSPNDLESLTIEDDHIEIDQESNQNNQINDYKTTLQSFYEYFKTILENEDNAVQENQQFIQLKCCLLLRHLLLNLNNSANSSGNSDSNITNDFIYSINDNKIIKSAIDLIIYWGFTPCFSNNIVGVPLGKRIGKKQLDFISQPESILAESIYRKSVDLSNYQLDTFTFLLLKLKEFNLDLDSIISSRYLVDIFSSLLQLINRPNSNNVNSNEDKVQRLSKYGKEIDKLLYKIHPDIVFESLMLLLSSCTPNVTPQWYTRSLGIMLSKCLLRPHALKILVQSIIGNSETNQIGNKSLNTIVQLVCTVPSQLKPNEYLEKISPQVIELLHFKDKDNTSRVQEIAIEIIDRLLNQYPELTLQYLISQTISPLITFTNLSTTSSSAPNNSDNNIVIKEIDIYYAIEDLHKILSKLVMNQTLLGFISKIIATLFQLYCFVSKSISTLKVSCKEILSTFFKFSNNSMVELKKLVLPIVSINNNNNNSSSKNNQSLMELEDILPDDKQQQEEANSEILSFTMAENGGVQAKFIKNHQRDFKWEAECIVSILGIMKNDLLAGNLFVDLLNEFSMYYDDKNMSGASKHKYFVLMQLIIIMSESLGSAVIKNVIQICTFIKVMLTRFIQKIQENHMENDEMVTDESMEDDQEMIILTLSILSSLLLGDVKVKKSEEILIFDLLPLIEQMSLHPDTLISSMSEQIKTIITVKKPTWLEDIQCDNSSNSTGNDSIGDDEDKLKEILKNLSDPLLPIRSHGLIELRSLVLTKSKVIERNLMNVLDVFKSQLADEDSFVYGCSVNGLSALGDIYPDLIIPLLIESFQTQTFSETKRMKIAESLMLVSQRCGDTLPKYSDAMVHSFLISCKDQNPIGVRMSSLSNIATICELLHYSIQRYLVEILHCIHSILQSEKLVEIRRSAIFVFILLLKGLGKDSFELIPDQLLSLYNTLKNLEFYETDEISKSHARSALYELSNITKSFVFPNSENSFQPYSKIHFK